MFIRILFRKIDFLKFQPLKNLFPKIGYGKIVKILFLEKMIRDLLESHHFVKFGIKRYGKSSEKIKFVKYIIFLLFKFFAWKIIFVLSN